VGLSAFVTTASAALLVPIGGIFAAHYINVAKLKAEVPKSGWLVPAIIVAVAIGATILIKAPSARKRVEHSLLQAKAYLTTVAEHPQRALVIAGGEFFTVACQVACLSLLLLAVHAPVRISAVLVISQLAGAASNVVPVPGGLGAPEAILTAGLTAFGLPEIDALIVAISYRMCVYWLPPLPGTLLLFDLVRRRLV
jgi:uncharacterized membrane protein YbhN (UPF0104 family)